MGSNAKCRHCGKSGTIKYYCLGISDKIKIMCEKMLAHWRNKEAWISGTGENLALKEVFDGSHLNKLSWFWNPNSQWMLPYKCKYCGNVISLEEIKAFPEQDGVYSVVCEECGGKTNHALEFARGEL